MNNEFFTENNLRIVETFRKRSLLKDEDEWNQLKHIIIWKASRDYSDGYGMTFTSYLFNKAKFEVMKSNTKIKKDYMVFSIDYCLSMRDAKNLEESTDIKDVLDSMAEIHSSILKMRFIDNYSSKEIRESLNIDSEEYISLLRTAILEFKNATRDFN